MMAGMAGTNLAGDGEPEIVSLGYAGRSAALGEPDPRRRLVLVLVESRLLAPLAGGAALADRLDRLVADVRREGQRLPSGHGPPVSGRQAQILRRWPWAPAFERTVSGVGQLAPLAQRVPRFRGQGYRRWWEPHHCCADGPAW